MACSLSEFCFALGFGGFWKQHSTKHQLYGHLPPITKTIQVRHAGHCWRSRDKLISDVLLWTPTYGRAKAGRLARTYIQQLCEDTGCSPEDLPEARDGQGYQCWWHDMMMMMMIILFSIYCFDSSKGILWIFPTIYLPMLFLFLEIRKPMFLSYHSSLISKSLACFIKSCKVCSNFSGFVPFFNGISIFVGYQMPKPFS